MIELPSDPHDVDFGGDSRYQEPERSTEAGEYPPAAGAASDVAAFAHPVGPPRVDRHGGAANGAYGERPGASKSTVTAANAAQSYACDDIGDMVMEK